MAEFDVSDLHEAHCMVHPRDELARKIYKNAHAALSPDEVSTIKDRIGKVMGAPIVGASWPLLDPTLRK